MKNCLFILALALFAVTATANAQTIVNQWPTGGAFAGGLEYDAGTGTIWLVDSNVDMVFQFDRNGKLLVSFPSPRTIPIGVGIDPSTGNLWIGDESEMVDEVTPAGVPTGISWPTTPTITDVSGAAVDPLTGHIFISQDSGTRQIAEFDQSGNVIQVIDLTGAGSTDPDGLGYNPSTMTFLLGEDTGDQIIEVDGNGNALNAWNMGALGISPEGVGVNWMAGTVFIADGFGNTVFEVAGLFSLAADALTLPEAGGAANFSLMAGSANAGRSYLILGSVSGTSPGTPLPGGFATLPLNWDIFTNLVVNLVNTNVFKDFTKALDGQGNGSAQLNLPAVSGVAGISMYFAYALNSPWDFASNPVVIQIVP